MAREPDEYPNTNGGSSLCQYASDVFDGGYFTIDGHVVFNDLPKTKTAVKEVFRGDPFPDGSHPDFD